MFTPADHTVGMYFSSSLDGCAQLLDAIKKRFGERKKDLPHLKICPKQDVLDDARSSWPNDKVELATYDLIRFLHESFAVNHPTAVSLVFDVWARSCLAGLEQYKLDQETENKIRAFFTELLKPGWSEMWGKGKPRAVERELLTWAEAEDRIRRLIVGCR
jgi:hypothetical protein